MSETEVSETEVRPAALPGEAITVDPVRCQPPVFMLAAPRSFTSLACAMLGQHPELYGLPETDLLSEPTMRAFTLRAARASYPMGHGVVRAVAELFFGDQTLASVELAQQWLGMHTALSTRHVFTLLASRVYPRTVVDKSLTLVHSHETLERLRADFPRARYIHLVRHPRGHGESMLKMLAWRRAVGPVPPNHWLLASSRPAADGDATTAPIDPQHGWYERQRVICDFLKSVPAEAQMRVRGEDLLALPDEWLRRMGAWLGVRTDDDAIEEMKHPERSPYVGLGPPGARYGNDIFFLRDPRFRPRPRASHCLDGPLAWTRDGREFLPEVKELARELGYS